MSNDLITPPPSEANAAIRGRVLQFDGLRAVAFLAVFINHATHTPLLWAGVDVFFVLSGFLITGILLERKRGGEAYFSYFYKRRSFRILPPLALAIVLHGFLISWAQFKPLWLFLLAPNVQGVVAIGPASLPIWSLAVEEQFYFIWPFVVLWCSETTLLRISLAALVITPLLRVAFTPLVPNMFYIYMLTPFRADLLCAGAVLALLWKRRDPQIVAGIRRWAWKACLVGLLLFTGTQAFPNFRLAGNRPEANGLVYLFSLVFASGLLAWVLSDTGLFCKLLSAAPLRYLGEISYTMYLVHMMILQEFQWHLGIHLWVDGLALLVIVAFASLSWFVLERPLIRFAARRPPQRFTLSEGPSRG